MNYITGRPTHIEDYLCRLHTGQWFGWSDSKNKVYANLIIHDDSKSKPSESDCTTGLATLQSAFDAKVIQEATDKTNGNQKLLDLGLTQAEATALTGYTPE
jgi:hypothetical protein